MPSPDNVHDPSTSPNSTSPNLTRLFDLYIIPPVDIEERAELLEMADSFSK